MVDIIYGKNVIQEALRANRKIYELYVLIGTNKDLVYQANKLNIKIIEMSKQEMNNKYKGNNQGVVAKVDKYEYSDFDEVLQRVSEKPLLIILDGLEDPHNLGAIIRTCDAAKVDGIIVPKNRSVKLSSTVAKVSTGAIEYVPVVEVTNITKTIQKLKKMGYWVVGTDAQTEKTHYDIDVDVPLALVIGSEGKGMSRLVKENCDYLVKIPMMGHVNSLNASVSAAIVIYEIVRKRS